MRIHLAIVAAFMLAAASQVGAAEETDGFVSLFDGKSLDGWRICCKPIDERWKMWRIDNGSILADSMNARGHDYSWLATRKEYGDFIFRMKFQAYRDSKGNSGVQIRSRYDFGSWWMDGPQVDINPPGPWRTGMMWDETRGNRRWICPDLPDGKWVDETMSSPKLKFYYSDQNINWNEMEITAVGSKVKVALNGVTVTDYDGKGMLDDKVHRERNTGTKGVIALQIHSGDQLRMRYKDIFIRELGQK